MVSYRVGVFWLSGMGLSLGNIVGLESKRLLGLSSAGLDGMRWIMRSNTFLSNFGIVSGKGYLICSE